MRGVVAWLRYEAIYLWPSWRAYSTFNPGYAPVDEAVAARFPAEARQVQLYAELLKTAGIGPEGVESKGLLEVAAGRGGGLRYMAGLVRAPRLIGLDRSLMAVLHGRRLGLDLRSSPAERLDFPDGAFEHVVCLDSANVFGDPARAFAEMGRVLAPGGTLLAGDFILGGIDSARDRLVRWAAGAGLEIAAFRDVTAHVVDAIRLDNRRKQALLETVPRLLRPLVVETLTLEGTERYREWTEGKRSYYLAALRRP